MKSELYIQICKYLKGLIAGTAWEGHLYAVGGCCRDQIMGDEIKDIDLAVDLPDGGVKFARWIARQHRVKGQPVFFRRFGTARFVLKRFPDAELEIVQTRKGKYDKTTDADPAAAFGSLEEDSFRRDLTMNTLFYDISREVMIDPTGMAMDDIRNCRLRTPMDPDLTFDDDPLRILRCVRFSIKYSHEIPSEMFEAMERHVPGLDNVSRERIHNEFDKILLSKDPVGGLRLLDSMGALHMIAPELSGLRSEIAADGRSFLEHAFDTLAGLLARRPGACWGARMAALFHDLAVAAVKCVNADGRVVYPGHAPATTRKVRMLMRRMRYEGVRVADVLFFIDYHMFGEYHPDPSRIKDRQLRRLHLDSGTRDRFDDLMALIDADKASYASSMVHTDDLTRRIVVRTDKMVGRGEALFDYILPLTEQEISLGIRSHVRGELEKASARLLKLACSNPRSSRADFLKVLGIDPAAVARAAAPVETKGRDGGRRRRNRNHRRRRRGGAASAANGRSKS